MIVVSDAIVHMMDGNTKYIIISYTEVAPWPAPTRCLYFIARQIMFSSWSALFGKAAQRGARLTHHSSAPSFARDGLRRIEGRGVYNFVAHAAEECFVPPSRSGDE